MPQDPTEPSSTESSSKEPSSKEPFSSHATHPGGARQRTKSSDEFAHEAASYRQDEASSFGEEHPSADAFATSRFAMEMAKGWVRQHQTAAMVGAFAVGAFVGALMRD